MGKIQALGKIAGSIAHRNFPKAGIFPVIRSGVRTTGRSRTTAFTASQHGEARQSASTGIAQNR